MSGNDYSYYYPQTTPSQHAEKQYSSWTLEQQQYTASTTYPRPPRQPYSPPPPPPPPPLPPLSDHQSSHSSHLSAHNSHLSSHNSLQNAHNSHYNSHSSLQSSHNSHLSPLPGSHNSHLSPRSNHQSSHNSHLSPHSNHQSSHSGHLSPHSSHLSLHSSSHSNHLSPHSSHLSPHLSPHGSHSSSHNGLSRSVAYYNYVSESGGKRDPYNLPPPSNGKLYSHPPPLSNGKSYNHPPPLTNGKLYNHPPSRRYKNSMSPYSSGPPQQNWNNRNPVYNKRNRKDSEDGNNEQKAKAPKKRKKPLSQNVPSKIDWTMDEAMMALNCEKEYNKHHKNQSLIIKFPDLELNKEIVSKFHGAIEHVHFQQPSTARFCFVTLEETADADSVINALNLIKFGDGKLTAEYKKDKEEDQDIGPEDIDPHALYVGNLAQEITKEDMVKTYPKCKRIDIGYAKKMKYTRYAFVSFKTVSDTVEAFKKTHNTQMYSKSLIVRFRRLNGTVGMPGETKPQNPPKNKKGPEETATSEHVEQLEHPEHLEQLEQPEKSETPKTNESSHFEDTLTMSPAETVSDKIEETITNVEIKKEPTSDDEIPERIPRRANKTQPLPSELFKKFRVTITKREDDSYESDQTQLPEIKTETDTLDEVKSEPYEREEIYLQPLQEEEDGQAMDEVDPKLKSGMTFSNLYNKMVPNGH